MPKILPWLDMHRRIFSAGFTTLDITQDENFWEHQCRIQNTLMSIKEEKNGIKGSVKNIQEMFALCAGIISN